MKRDIDVFKRTLDVVTTVIITGGLILAFDQAREIRKSLDLSTWNSVAEQWLSFIIATRLPTVVSIFGMALPLLSS